MLRSLEEKERLFLSVTLDEFLKQALLRVELDEERQVLRAVRGGYELPLANIECGYFSPSAFNDRRYWCAYEDRVVFFPYFDPAISLSARVSGPVDPELDPALIFAALGDSTRYAIVSLLAAQPRSASDLARALELSKPTVSHHLARLRQAGLLEERYQGGSVTLTLRRSVIESLTQITLASLYGQRR
ncbi:MAG: winged helix-turn-helix transcriptional regulator [Armatimonadetes bacterium]|nr:winged helix-turn-helix transcriptional regulator [Armatimonadota bacterium]